MGLVLIVVTASYAGGYVAVRLSGTVVRGTRPIGPLGVFGRTAVWLGPEPLQRAFAPCLRLEVRIRER